MVSRCIPLALLVGILGSLTAPPAHAYAQNLCNTPAYNNPTVADDLEGVPLGQLPPGWNFFGSGSAVAVNTQNHTPGGAQSVELAVNPGGSAILQIPFPGAMSGTALALRTPNTFGKDGLLITRVFANWGGTPGTLIAENIIHLQDGVVDVLYPGIGGTPQGFTFTGPDIDGWRVDDLDTLLGAITDPVPKECWHSGGGTNWCGTSVPPQPADLEVFEIELVSTGVDALSVYLDDFHSYDQLIVEVCGPSLLLSGVCPAPSDFDAIAMTPGGTVYIGYSLTPGSWNIPGGPVCVGTTLSLVNPTLLAVLTADAQGHAVFGGNPPPIACGLVHVLAFDVASCTETNVVPL